MKLWIMLPFTFFFLSHVWGVAHRDTVLEETLYQNFRLKILAHTKHNLAPVTVFGKNQESLFVDALWDLADEGNEHVLDQDLAPLTHHYQLIERLRLAILQIKHQRAKELPEELQSELMNALVSQQVDTKIIYTLAAYEEELLAAGHGDIILEAQKHPSYYDIAEDETRHRQVTGDVITDLVLKTPDVTTYMNGEYSSSVKLFMFCRENRLYPCLMIMKDVQGKIIRNADGSLWTQEALASSSKGLPSYARNGNTPAGILTIDSVMPVADQRISFGKFRRMILNFIPKSKDEILSKKLLPPSSHTSDWWKAAQTARDIGRNLLRIHGTGKINNDPTTPYYPFMRTSGCIAQKENTYEGVTFQDQRDLLDKIMKAMEMVPTYENEVRIKGILYLVNIDDQNASVTIQDLALRGIE